MHSQDHAPGNGERGAASVRGAAPVDIVACGVLGGALLLHLGLAAATGYERDIYWFGTWMRVGLEHGVARIAANVPCDYLPGYLYVLKAVGALWTLVTRAPLPADGSVALRFLVKLVPILSDLAGAWVVYRLALPQLGRTGARWLLAAYAFNPALLFSSAVWGQAESLTALLALLAVRALMLGSPAGAALWATALVWTKAQTIVLLPALVFGAYRLQGGTALREMARSAGIVTLLVLLPFFWAQRVDSVLGAAFDAVGRYPVISLNAHNLWWWVGGLQSSTVADAMRVGNALLTYHDLGLIMLTVAMALVLWRLASDLSRNRGAAPAALLRACTLEFLAFYLFPTQMHERYILPAVAVLAALCIWQPRAWLAYVMLTLATFVSLASTLHAIYPGSVGALAAFLPAARQETYGASVLFLGVFVWLLFAGADTRFRAAAPAAAVAVAAVVALLVWVPVTRSARLSDWEPVQREQGWGALHRDRTVDDGRLSVASFIFRHGIGTHAESRLTYHLNRAFRSFDTLFAIDDEANRGQKMQFRILVDGQVRFDSGLISGVTFPRHTRVPVEHADRLTLEVLDGGDGINADHADWLEPMLFR